MENINELAHNAIKCVSRPELQGKRFGIVIAWNEETNEVCDLGLAEKGQDIVEPGFVEVYRVYPLPSDWSASKAKRFLPTWRREVAEGIEAGIAERKFHLERGLELERAYQAQLQKEREAAL